MFVVAPRPFVRSVNGHLKFPMGGQEKSPDTVIDLPGYGHQIPHVAMV